MYPTESTNLTDMMARPKHLKSPKQIQQAIDQYFSDCDDRCVDVYDKKTQEVNQVSTPAPYTIEGLCNQLEMDRETFLAYEMQEEQDALSKIIRRAKRKVQHDHVERALDGRSNATLAIFLMKNNFGYKDRSEQDANINLLTPLKIEVINEDAKRELKDLKNRLQNEDNERI